MKQKISFIIFTFVIHIASIQYINAQEILREVDTIPIALSRGKIAQLAIDIDKLHLFITFPGNNSVEVLNLKSKKIVRSIRNLKTPQGVAYVPNKHHLYISQRDNGTVRILDTVNYNAVQIIDFKHDADRILYVPQTNSVLVSQGSGGIGIIDANTMIVKRIIYLGGHPEGIQVSSDGKTIYANIPALNSIDVLDYEKKIAGWETYSSYTNFPMAIDHGENIIAIANRTSSPTIVLLDTQGRKLQETKSLDKVGDLFFTTIDDVLFLMAISGRGQIIVWRIETQSYDMRQMVPIQKIITRENTETGLFVPELETLFVAIPQQGTKDAEIRLFSTK